MSGSRQETLGRLVTRYLEESTKDGDRASLEDICRDHPELVEEVRRSVGIADSLEGLYDSRGPTGRVIGQIIADRYQVVEPIGSGAMGVVYAAEDLELGRTVAVKIVHTGLMDKGTAFARFEREAEALAAIKHASVVTIFDRGLTESGSPFLVMEYLDGIQCSDLLDLARTKLGQDDDTSWLKEALKADSLQETSYLRQVFRWAAGLASGLHAAHEAGIYHRDIKPSNIMICRDGRAVLLDFGIATRVNSATLTRTGTAVGTPAYMAPETLLPNSKPDARLDVYGLAATLYHMLTLRAPFEGSPVEIFSALATREPEQASRVRPGLPRDAQAILDAGMAQSSNSRYPSALAVERDLQALLAFQPISVRPTSGWARNFRRLRRSRFLAGGAVIAILIGASLQAKGYLAARADAREAAYHDVHEHVPANLGIGGYSNRTMASAEGFEEVARVLDELVETGHDVVPALAQRLSFRLDHGDVGGAASDMREISEVLGTEYSDALAAQYAALSVDSRGVRDLSLEVLPEPASALDKFLVGFHLMRTLRYEEAAPWLRDEALHETRLARELALLTRLLELVKLQGAGELDALYERAEEVNQLADQLDQQFGGASASTSHIRSFAKARQLHYQAALQEAEQGLGLSPWSHGTLVNAAEVARRLGRFDIADEYSSRGLAIVPNYFKLQQNRFYTARDRGDFALAREQIARADFPERSGGDELRLFESLTVDIEEAIELLESSPEASSSLCSSVVERAERADEELSGQLAFGEIVINARAVATGDLRALISPQLRRLSAAPLDLVLLASLPQLLDGLPAGELSPADGEALLGWIIELEQALSRPSRLGASMPR